MRSDAKQHAKAGPHKPPVVDKEEDVLDEDEDARSRSKERGKALGLGGARVRSAVSTTMIQRDFLDFLTGGKKVAFKPGWRPPVDYKLTKPAPKRSNSDSSTTLPTTPKFAGHTAYEAAAKKWRYQVESITSPGKIQIVYYTKDHYPAPTPTDDSGVLSNVTKDNWRDIVQDLRDNRTGIADQWSAYQAEDLHENYHWVDEWQAVSKPKFAEAQTEIAALEEPEGDGKTGVNTQYDANKILEPKATKIFLRKVKEARTAFNALGDRPGDPPYIAQAPAIDALIKRVEDHAAAMGWSRVRFGP